MSISIRVREQAHRAYLDFAETAHRKRAWSVFDDVPWDRLIEDQRDEQKAIRIETFCAEEMYLPDFSRHGVELARSSMPFAWFQIQWSQEESRHGLALREYLLRSGLRSQAEFEAFWMPTFAQPWNLPFSTLRQMVAYGALQESATFRAYNAQRLRCEEEGDVVLQSIFSLLARDEAAHAGFYRTVLEFELEEDRASTLRDIAFVLANFRMPGQGLIPEYEARLRAGEGGITTRTFVKHVLLTTLRSLGIERSELRAAAACGDSDTDGPVEGALLVDGKRAFRAGA
jgi:acyl-[acyl-carrier-protein] desaturase